MKVLGERAECNGEGLRAETRRNGGTRGRPGRPRMRIRGLRSEMDTRLFDYRTVEAAFTVDSRGKLEFPATVVQHHGRNKKQNEIESR